MKCYRCNSWPCVCKDRITLIHGDALTFMAASGDGAFDIVFTDPPYSSGARQTAMMRSRAGMRRDEGKHGKWIGGDNLSSHGFAMLVRLFGVESHRIICAGGHLFCFIDWRQWPVLHSSIDSSGWSVRSCLVWDKEHFGMGNGFRQQAEFVLHASKGVADNFVRHDLGTVFRCRRDQDDTHPTMKPLGPVVDMLSAVPGANVLDPFCGSGTTLFAAKQLRRKATGVEINEAYCEIAANRLRQEVLQFGE